MVARITSGGIARNASSNEPISTTGHSTRPGDLLQQPLVLDQLEALREGEVLGVGQDDLAAARRVEHDLGLFELGHVVVEAAHLDRRRAPGSGGRAWSSPDCDAADLEPHDLGLFGLRPEGRDDGMQRPHPVERARLRRRSPQRIDFGHGKLRDDLRHDLGDHVDAPAGPASRSPRRRSRPSCPAGPSPRSIEVRPAAFRKPAIACSGAPTRGPFALPSRPADRAGTPCTVSASRRGVAKALAPS